MTVTASCVMLLGVLAGCGEPAGATGVADGPATIVQVPVAERVDAPELRAETLDGEPFDSADLEGQVVVYNVWGSWCAPCIAEAPALERTWQAVRSQDVQFVGINTRDNPAAAQAHERRFGVSYPSIPDNDGEVLLAFRGTLPAQAIPNTLVVDREGRIAARVIGEVSESTLRGLLEDTLAESPARST
jgi:thiol-disulfide isomerase/thioredoxin